MEKVADLLKMDILNENMQVILVSYSGQVIKSGKYEAHFFDDYAADDIQRFEWSCNNYIYVKLFTDF